MSIKNTLFKINKYGATLILLAPLIVSNNFIFPYIHLKNIYFRSLTLILILTLIWYLLERGKEINFYNYIGYSLIGFILLQILASFFGVNIYNSFFGSWERMDGIWHLVLVVFYFFLLINTFKKERDWISLFRYALIPPLLVIIYGFLKNGFEVFNNEWSAIGNSAFLSFYLLLNLGITGILYTIDKKNKWRIFYLVVIILNLIVIFLAASRASILGLFFGCMLGVLFYLPKATKKFRLFSFSIFIIFILLSSLILWQKDSRIVQSINFLDRIAHISTEDYTTNNRLLVWQSGLQAFKEKPILGFGSENFFYGINRYYNASITEQWFDKAHNFIVDYLVSSGIFGLLGYLVIFITASYYIWIIRRKNILLASVLFSFLGAYLFTNLFVFDTLNTWLILMLFLAFITWCVKYGLEENIKAFDNKKVHSNTYYNFILGITTFFIIFVGYSIVVKPVYSNYLTAQAYRYSQEDFHKSLEYYDKAFELNTFGQKEGVLQMYRYSLSAIKAPEVTIETKRDIFNETEEKILQYLARDDHNIQVRIALAQLYLAYGDFNSFYINESIGLLESNIDDSPGRLDIYYILAQAYYLKGDTTSAIDYLEKSYIINNSVESVYENLMNIYSFTGNVTRLEELIEEYLSKFIDIDSEKYRKIGDYYFRVGLTNQAEKILLDKAIPADINSWRGYVSLASIYESRGEYQAAISYLKDILLLHSEFEEVFNDYIEKLENKY